MSFDIGVWRSNTRLSNKQAQVVFEQLNEDDVSSVVNDDSLLKFYDDLDAIFPLGGNISDEAIEGLPWSWSCSPSRTHYVLGVRGPKGGEAINAVMDLAHKHGLIVFDPQRGVIEVSNPPVNLLRMPQQLIARLARLFRSH